MAIDLRSKQFRDAVRNIQRRAERQLLDEKLVRCFVPNRVLDELNSTSNQLLFGRRGVGKTHTLKVFAGEHVLAGELTVYLDCTSFGSGLGSDGSDKNVGIRFFRTLLRTLTDSLLDHASRREPPLDGIDNKILVALANIESASEAKGDGTTFDYIGIQRFVNEFLDLIGAARVTILLDEWAQVPRNAQPFFAEFIKRAFFANPRVAMKIGVVDFTYRPGERYSLVTMDYGTYVSFRGTKNEPEQKLFWLNDETHPANADLVPLDDRRSIRRIIVGEEVLERFWQSSDS